MSSQRQDPRPPTLEADALRGLLQDFGNCYPTREDGALAYRACRASPGASASGEAMWIYRIDGCDLGGGIGATIVSLSSVALTQEDADARGDTRGSMHSYAPAATYESGRAFFAGSKASARRLLDAFEQVASESEALATALRHADEGGSGLEAVLFEWPKGDAALLTICNANHSEERSLAVEALLLEAEARLPGAVSHMESRSDNDYTFATYEIWRDETVEDGPPSERVLLAIYDQSEDAQQDLIDNPESCENLARALHRREIDRATAPGPGRARPKRV